MSFCPIEKEIAMRNLFDVFEVMDNNLENFLGTRTKDYISVNNGAFSAFGEDVIETTAVGFNKDEIKITYDEPNQKVIVKANSESSNKLTSNKMNKSFYIGNMEVDKVTLENGILRISLKPSEKNQKEIKIT